MENRVKIDAVLCWSDSEVALAWIKGKEKSWKPWVENRVVEIRKVVDRAGWKYVNTELNPADVPTRMSSDICASFTGCWFKGPLFLLSLEVDTSVACDTSGDKLSLVGMAEVQNFSVQTHEGPEIQTCSLSSAIQCDRFSSLKKLVMVTGYVLRFINNLKKKVLKKTNLVTEDMLTVNEYNEALLMWIKDEQFRLKQQDNYSKLEASLQLFKDKDGVLRLRGRFANTSLPYKEQYPIILRKQSHFTRLVILNAHEETMHHGIETTLARIRTEYWIVEGRKSVKKILRKCVVCIRVQGLPMRAPPSPDLPDFRVNYSGHAFQATGLDFAGPLFIKEGSKKEKTYVLLLTCATSRAIHLELVPDMSIGGFLRGFKRFLARRGTPDIVIHDNFKTFKATAVKRFMLLQGIKQNFILPLSPWWGGFYERLVRSVKTCLKKTLGKSFLTFEELQTVLCEIEASINNRPLAYVSDDDLDDALTPYHLIHGRNISKPSEAIDFIPATDVENCKRRQHHVLKVLRDCWTRFRSTYLNELRQINLYRKCRSNDSRHASVGDVVLIMEDKPSVRTEWRMGKVIEFVKGRDDQVRGAKLKVWKAKGTVSSTSETDSFRNK